MTGAALLRELTPARAFRAAAVCLVFGIAVAGVPNLEDAGSLGLFFLIVCGVGFPLLATGGVAYAFAARSLGEARARAEDTAELARLSVVFFCMALWAQAPVVYVENWGLWHFALLLAAWRLWCDWPWTTLDERRAERLAATASGAVARYEPKIETAPIPASTKPLGELAEALLVSSGSFRVDRSRMIKVLSRFQTADPAAFVLPWLRLAVASGAKILRLETRPDGLELAFDGKPLAERWCKDPFAPFLEGDESDDPEAERHKHLARGILTLLPLTPGAIAVHSGRTTVRLEPKGETIAAWPAPESGTSIRVRLPAAASFEAVSRAKEAWGLVDAELRIDGSPVPSWEPAPGVGERFESGKVRGIFFRAEADVPPLRLYHLGAALPEAVEGPLLDDVVARFTYDGLKLDASSSKPIKNEAFKKAVWLTQDICTTMRKTGKLGPDAPRLRALAYTKPGLYAALAGGVLAFMLLLYGADTRPEVAWGAAAVYAVVTLGILTALGSWFVARLSGRRNPFRA